MDELTIGAFATRVGLAPSALRFYDDCDVLKPARVDGTTGYRHYRADQVERGLLLRDLRAAGLPLAEVVTVLDGPPVLARDLLETHLHRLRETTTAAETAIERILTRAASVSVGGPELAAALRQVMPSAADSPEFPVLGCVLFELTGGEFRLVATDRYRLAVRGLRPDSATGAGRFLAPAPGLAELARWAARRPRVSIEFERGRVEAAGEPYSLSIMDGEFPSYRDLLAALAPPRHRILVDRLALLEALPPEPFVLRAGPDELTAGDRTVPALCAETVPPIGFDPRMLASAVETSVGPDVLLEITGPREPVVVRSADQGSFTTLVMPYDLTGRS
jgi:DNA-binding transcriptional MerR regulator